MSRKKIDNDYYGFSDENQDDDQNTELHPVGDLFDDDFQDEDEEA